MWWGGDYLARKNKLFIFKTERVSLILRIINVFCRVRIPFIQSNNSFGPKKRWQNNSFRDFDEKLLAFPAHLLTVCVSRYGSGFKVGAFLLGLFADGVFVFFSYRACYIMFAGAFFFARGCE